MTLLNVTRNDLCTFSTIDAGQREAPVTYRALREHDSQHGSWQGS